MASQSSFQFDKTGMGEESLGSEDVSMAAIEGADEKGLLCVALPKRSALNLPHGVCSREFSMYIKV